SLTSTPSLLTPPPTTEIYTLSLHDALPILAVQAGDPVCRGCREKHARRRFGSLTAIAQPERQWQFLATQSSFHEPRPDRPAPARSEEHTSELQSLRHLVCRLLLEKKNNKKK